MSDSLEDFQQKVSAGFPSAGFILTSEELKLCWSVRTRRWKGPGCYSLIKSAVTNTHKVPILPSQKLRYTQKTVWLRYPSPLAEPTYQKNTVHLGVMFAVLLANMALPNGLPCSARWRRPRTPGRCHPE